MPILLECPSCSTTMKAPDNSAGKNARCPKCRHVFPIIARDPAPSAAPSPAPTPPPPVVPAFTPPPEPEPEPADDLGLDFLPEGDAAGSNPYKAPAVDLLGRSSIAPLPPDRPAPLAFVAGKPASIWGGAVVPATFGRTILRLLPDRLVEETRRPIERRDCEILISEVESGELVVKGNPVLLLLGIGTLALFGLGILFIAGYFLFKHRFLIIHSKANAVIVSLRGEDSAYRQFLDEVLARARGARGG